METTKILISNLNFKDIEQVKYLVQQDRYRLILNVFKLSPAQLQGIISDNYALACSLY
jgi:hypothetical protein